MGLHFQCSDCGQWVEGTTHACQFPVGHTPPEPTTRAALLDEVIKAVEGMERHGFHHHWGDGLSAPPEFGPCTEGEYLRRGDVLALLRKMKEGQ